MILYIFNQVAIDYTELFWIMAQPM